MADANEENAKIDVLTTWQALLGADEPSWLALAEAYPDFSFSSFQGRCHVLNQVSQEAFFAKQSDENDRQHYHRLERRLYRDLIRRFHADKCPSEAQNKAADITAAYRAHNNVSDSEQASEPHQDSVELTALIRYMLHSSAPAPFENCIRKFENSGNPYIKALTGQLKNIHRNLRHQMILHHEYAQLKEALVRVFYDIFALCEDIALFPDQSEGQATLILINLMVLLSRRTGWMFSGESLADLDAKGCEVQRLGGVEKYYIGVMLLDALHACFSSSSESDTGIEIEDQLNRDYEQLAGLIAGLQGDDSALSRDKARWLFAVCANFSIWRLKICAQTDADQKAVIRKSAQQQCLADTKTYLTENRACLRKNRHFLRCVGNVIFNAILLCTVVGLLIQLGMYYARHGELQGAITQSPMQPRSYKAVTPLMNEARSVEKASEAADKAPPTSG